jgi:hypothetical protein
MKSISKLALAAIAIAMAGSVWVVAAKEEPRSLPSLAELQQRAADLAAQTQRLRDEKEIENLQRIYGYYQDKKLWSEAVAMFAAQGTLELGQSGVYVGRERIRHFFSQFGPDGLKEGQLYNHMQLQPVIHVADDGTTAKGRWRGFNQAGEFGKRAIWGEGVYENEYVKEEGVWKIQKLHYFNSFTTPYEKGWAKEVMPSSRPVAKGFEPDLPPTVVYEGFPKYFVAPFHYPNPVTGKPPRIGVTDAAAQGEKK